LILIDSKKIRLFIIIAVILLAVVFLIDNTTTVLKLVYPMKHKEFVFRYSKDYNIDPLLVFSIIKAESGFDKDAVSYRNAMGLMQITEETAVWGASEIGIENFSVRDLFDPEINIKIGCWYLNRLMKEFDNDLDLIIAAYNGGSGNVKKWLKDSRYSSSPNKLDIIPFRETERYLKKVKNNYYIYKKLYQDEIRFYPNI